jgi:hypothetical protein
MCSLIGFGHWSPYYYYILIATLTRFLKDDILGVGVDHQIIVGLKIVFHPVMILLIGYTSDFILSLILWKFFDYREKKKEAEKYATTSDNEEPLSKKSTPDKIFELKDTISSRSLTINDDDLRSSSGVKSDNNLKYYLIHNDLSSEVDYVSKSSFIFILLSSCLITIKEFISKVLYSSHDIFDYYFLNLIIIAIILNCFYKRKIYKHHKLAIILVSVISGSCLIACILVSLNYNFEGETMSFSINYTESYHIIFIFIFIYIIISIFFCTGIIFQKNLMQKKFISSYKFLFFKGIFGIFFSIIALICTTNIPCEHSGHPPPPMDNSSNIPFGPPPDLPPDVPFGPPRDFNNRTEQDLQLFMCRDHYFNESYFDNFYSYFNNTVPNLQDNTIAEIFILIGYFILNFISDLSIILVNKFLSPYYYLITESFYSLMHIPYQYFTRVSIDDLKNIIEQSKTENSEYDLDKLYQSIFQKDGPMLLKFTAAFFEFLGYMIYMEVIQLNFCGLNRDLSKNIKKRAKLDAIISEKDLNEDNDINDISDSIEAPKKYKKKYNI